MQLMAFTDEQLAQIRDAAQQIPRAQRAAYLERVTALLAGRQFGNRDVQRAAAQAQGDLVGAPATEGIDRHLTRPSRIKSSLWRCVSDQKTY
jgi:hypothetical protein